MSTIKNPKNTDSIPQPPENGESPLYTTKNNQLSQTMNDSSHMPQRLFFINNRYTNPVTIDFDSFDSDNTVNLQVKHRKIFIAIKLLDLSASTTMNDKVITNHVELHMGTAYTETFDVITDKNTKFPRTLVHHDLHSTLNVSAMKYGDHNIMSTLQPLRTWTNFNKLSTHRVASIGFLKYVSICLTLHSTGKKRVTNALMNVDLNENNITTLKECVSTNANPNQANKRSPDDNRKDPTKNSNTIVFPAFDISTKRVGFGNGNARVTTVAYEIRCHFDHATLLKSIFIQASVLDPISASKNYTHFIPYGLFQTTYSFTVKNQTIQQNRFLAQTGIVPILKIANDTMTSGLK